MTTNLSKNMEWFKIYIGIASAFNRASITASYHQEYIKDNNKFANKLLFLQNAGIKITINIVMVPERFDELYKIALFFYGKGLNTTLKPQSDPHANYVVKGYTEDQLAILHNGMPQLDNKKPFMQVKLTDDTGYDWYMDQAERFNAFNWIDSIYVPTGIPLPSTLYPDSIVPATSRDSRNTLLLVASELFITS